MRATRHQQLDAAARPRHRFDIVSAFDVFFHIVDDGGYDRAVRNVSDLLRPGGVFVFSEHLLPRVRRTGPHRVSCPAGEVLSLLHRYGMEPVRRVPMFIAMEFPISSSGASSVERRQVMDSAAAP